MDPEGYRAIVASPGRMGSYHLHVVREPAGLGVEAVVDPVAEVETDRLCPATPVAHVPVGTMVNRTAAIIQQRA